MNRNLLIALALLPVLCVATLRGQDGEAVTQDVPSSLEAEAPLPPDIESAVEEDARLTPRVGPLLALEVDEAIDILDLLHPDLALELRRLREDQPEEVARLVATRFPRIRQMLVLKRTDREMFDLQVASFRANRDVQQAKERLRDLTYSDDAGSTQWQEKWDEARKNLRDRLARRYQVQHQIRGHEVEKAREKVAQLDELLKRQWDERKRRVEDQFDQMIEAEGLENPVAVEERSTASRSEEGD